MKIAVIGSGVMGAGIAQVLAAKHKVILRDILPEASKIRFLAKPAFSN